MQQKFGLAVFIFTFVKQLKNDTMETLTKIKEQTRELDILNKVQVAANLLSEVSLHTGITPEELTSGNSLLVALINKINKQNS